MTFLSISITFRRMCFFFRSANIGVFICLKCCGVHRSLGSHISKVRKRGCWSQKLCGKIITDMQQSTTCEIIFFFHNFVFISNPCILKLLHWGGGVCMRDALGLTCKISLICISKEYAKWKYYLYILCFLLPLSMSFARQLSSS